MIEKIKKTAEFLKAKITETPKTGIILGSGLGGFANGIKNKIEIPYSEIPNFPVSTVEGHSGTLIFGQISGKNVVAMKGRFHYYEGYDMKAVTFPVRVMKFLGVENLIVSNAAGGLNPEYKTGDLMIISDHINFFPESPLRGKNFNELGTRFPDMSKVYDEKFISITEEIAKEINVKLQKGIYIGSTGPTLETPAEYRMFRLFGADATGMSTVPEVIVAHHQGMKCFGLSVITNESEPENPDEITTHEEVQKVASEAEKIMSKVVEKLLERI